MMGSTLSNNDSNKGPKPSVRNAPFSIQIPSSLKDPQAKTFSIYQLERLQNISDARNIALGYLHDPKEFASFWHSDKPYPQTRRLMRELAQIQTINAVYNCFYRLANRTKIDLDLEKMVDAARNTKQYTNNYKYDTTRQQVSYSNPAKVFVVDGDCLDAALYIKEKYPNYNPVVLNMANANTPGGGWRNGCGAQEENLHRRTNLFQCLEDPYDEFYRIRNWRYPIPDFGGLYSPNVSVFRGSEAQGYPFFPDGPKYTSFISCAAYANPRTKRNNDGELQLNGDSLIQNTKNKINTIFKIALENQHDIIILSAFGCGAFGNPPKHIAKLFQEIISQKYSHSFKAIVFAILNDHNSMQAHNPHGNIQPFAEIFNVPISNLNQI